LAIDEHITKEGAKSHDSTSDWIRGDWRRHVVERSGSGSGTESVASAEPATGDHARRAQDVDGRHDEGCREHCQATTKSIDQMTKTIDEAKASNDPVKMRAVLDQAQKPLAEMKNHMSMCMNMTNMMEKMHGKGGMMPSKPPQENR
jgi:hypothetical protein